MDKNIIAAKPSFFGKFTPDLPKIIRNCGLRYVEEEFPEDEDVDKLKRSYFQVGIEIISLCGRANLDIEGRKKVLIESLNYLKSIHAV